MIHSLKRQSSFIVVVLRSLVHKACIRCGQSIGSLEESSEHWEKELAKSEDSQKSGYLFEVKNERVC